MIATCAYLAGTTVYFALTHDGIQIRRVQRTIKSQLNLRPTRRQNLRLTLLQTRRLGIRNHRRLNAALVHVDVVCL